MANKNKKLTDAQIKALRKALAASPGNISSPAVSKATMFALAARKLLIATYTPFHSATDRPIYRISNAGREVLANIDAEARRASAEAQISEENRAAEVSLSNSVIDEILVEEKIVEGLTAGLQVFHTASNDDESAGANDLYENLRRRSRCPVCQDGACQTKSTSCGR